MSRSGRGLGRSRKNGEVVLHCFFFSLGISENRDLEAWSLELEAESSFKEARLVSAFEI